MTLETWLRNAIADADERGLPELRALLEGLAQSTRALRSADFNERADDDQPAQPRVPDDGR